MDMVKYSDIHIGQSTASRRSGRRQTQQAMAPTTVWPDIAIANATLITVHHPSQPDLDILLPRGSGRDCATLLRHMDV